MESKTGPKDIFLHLLSIIALYVSVGTLITLLFQYINVLIPDPLEAGYYYITSIYNSIRWSISILIILFPVYCWTVWYLNKGYIAVPEKREMRSRKWLVYLTLFLAALIIIGDLVALVYNLLRGEFTSRFLLKVLTVFLVSGSVFVYYFWEVKRAISEKMPALVAAVKYISIAAVAAAIIGGFFIVGSPAEERAYRFDDQRVQDLQMIQSNILSFWQSKKRLPENLLELRNEFSGFTPPQDPETNQNYIYKRTGELKFELCANFARANRSGSPAGAKPLAIDPYYVQDNWQHEAGEYCFSRTIDPEIYPPFEKPVPARQ